MPKSRKRGGQKAHNKRVNARNQRIDVERKKMQQAYTDMFQQRLEEFQNQYSGMSETTPDLVDADVISEETIENVETTISTNEQ